MPPVASREGPGEKKQGKAKKNIARLANQAPVKPINVPQIRTTTLETCLPLVCARDTFRKRTKKRVSKRAKAVALIQPVWLKSSVERFKSKGAEKPRVGKMVAVHFHHLGTGAESRFASEVNGEIPFKLNAVTPEMVLNLELTVKGLRTLEFANKFQQ